jgi:hypothetical protein
VIPLAGGRVLGESGRRFFCRLSVVSGRRAGGRVLTAGGWLDFGAIGESRSLFQNAFIGAARSAIGSAIAERRAIATGEEYWKIRARDRSKISVKPPIAARRRLLRAARRLAACLLSNESRIIKERLDTCVQ